jgi:hypothetical protein
MKFGSVNDVFFQPKTLEAGVDIEEEGQLL